MPDFGIAADFIPLLNEKPVTEPVYFELEVDRRASKRKIQGVQAESKQKRLPKIEEEVPSEAKENHGQKKVTIP